MNKLKLFFVVLTVLALSAIAAPAMAGQGVQPQVQQPGPVTVDFVQQVIEQTPNNVLVAYGSAPGVDKQAVDAATQGAPAEAVAEPDGVLAAPNSIWYKYYSASGQTNWGGSYVKTYYNSTRVKCNNADCGGWCATALVNGVTNTTWYGANPYYPDQIKLGESWKYSGTTVSVSVGSSSVGGSFSASGSTVSWDSGWVNSAGQFYKLANTYSGVQGKSYIALWRVDDSASGSHRFGGQFVTAIANGGTGF